MPSPQETELKLLLPGLDGAQAYRRLRLAPALQGLRPQRRQLTNHYLDTPTLDLQNQRCALRLRHNAAVGRTRTTTPEGHWVQTFKTAGTDRGGLSQRGEWNTPLAGPRPDLTALQALTTQVPLLPPGWVERLQPCFETRCLRTTWRVPGPGGALVEVALDVGTIHAGGQSQELLELELELLAGPLDALLSLAQALATCVPVLPSDCSKAERGYTLAAGWAHTPTRARVLPLPRNATPQQVAPPLLAEAFGQFTRNLATLAHRHTPEVVHQARVGWRRWRSLLRLLQPWLPPGPDSSALQPLLHQLGLLRDSDVARQDTLPRWASAFQAEVGVHAPELAAAWSGALRSLEQHSQQTHQQVCLKLADPTTGAGLLAIAVWLQTLNTTPQTPTDPGWAVQRIKPWYRQARGLLGSAVADTGALHRGRLLAKRVRYAIEAVGPSLRQKDQRRVRPWLRLAARWQSGVGTSRDTQQAVRVLALAGAPVVVLAFVAGVVASHAVKMEGCSNPPASGSTP